MWRTLACFGSLTVVPGKIYFQEIFNDSAWEDRWQKSHWKDGDRTGGKFQLATGKFFNDALEDRGLQTVEDGKFFDISTQYESFNSSGMEKVIFQFQVKAEQEWPCGGAYLKFGPKLPDGGWRFGDWTPYHIMFGPDKCGYTKRTHLIFAHKGRNVLKKTDLLWKQDPVGTSHLYRLTLMPDFKVKVDLDGEKLYEGSLKEDWELELPKYIIDYEDKKPDDWVDEFKIDDPTDKKPDNWVEEKRVPNYDHKKPEEWDDEEDGPWVPPLRDNPEFKGEWYQKRITNPLYKGYWEHRKIPNPEYEEDNTVAKYEDFSFVGLDVWQVKSGTIFDNIIITDDVAEADEFVEKWKVLYGKEKELKAKDDAAKEAQEQRKADEFDADEDAEAESDEM